jgi:hypothetical protein
MMHASLITREDHGHKNEKRNPRVRRYSTYLDKDESEKDIIVHRINVEVTKRIDCTKCANCCKEMGPRLTKQDIRAISKYLDITEEKVISKYLKERKDKVGEYLVARIPCSFLKENRCRIYDVRPEDCKSYPHLTKAQFISRLAGLVERYPVCPIVVEVYNQSKTEIRLNA